MSPACWMEEAKPSIADLSKCWRGWRGFGWTALIGTDATPCDSPASVRDWLAPAGAAPLVPAAAGVGAAAGSRLAPLEATSLTTADLVSGAAIAAVVAAAREAPGAADAEAVGAADAPGFEDSADRGWVGTGTGLGAGIGTGAATGMSFPSPRPNRPRAPIGWPGAPELGGTGAPGDFSDDFFG